MKPEPDVIKRKRSPKAVVIDDDPAALLYVRHVLQRRGYEVLTFENPIHCPLYECDGCPCSLENRCPDLIISDFNMPGVNGVELLELSKKKGCRCRHFALISGNGLQEDNLLRIHKIGTRYFAKPLDLDEFHSWLDHIERDLAE